MDLNVSMLTGVIADPVETWFVVLYLLSSSDVVDDDDEGISADTVLA